MPPQTVLKSKPDEKDVELLDYSSAINQLNVVAKKDLEETKNQISLANYQLAMLRDKIIKDTNDLESFKRAEKLKFNNENIKFQNEIIVNKNKINSEVLQQERIIADLRTQQTKFEGLAQERIKIKEELMRLEARKLEAEDLFKQAEAMKASVLTSQNQASMGLAKSQEETEKNKQENIRLVALNDTLARVQKKLDEDVKNFNDLKEFVEPKLRAIKDEQAALERAKVENNERIAQLQQTMQDEKILLQSVLDKKAQLEKEMSLFQSQKEEFNRQQILATPTVVK